MKKKLLALLLTLCMMLSVLPFGAAAADFTDVESGAYYERAVEWAVNAEPQITNGISATLFAPNQTCTRAQVATFLWRAMGQPKVAGANPFSDVHQGEYFYDAVLWANATGVTNGTSPTAFSPENPCTRGQVATFLWRAMGKPATSISNPFTDVNQGAYYDQAVLWAFEAGVTNGTSATAFSPDATCTRGQIVTFLYRAFNPEYMFLVVKETNVYDDGSQDGFIWTYDDRGNNVRVETLNGLVWEEYTFDSNGKRISKKDHWGNIFPIDDDDFYTPADVDEKYDDQGRLIEEVYHYTDGDESYHYTYDAQGNLVQIVSNWIGGWKDVETITYYENGNWATDVEQLYDESGVLQSTTTYYYNEETGSIEKIITGYPDGSSEETTFRSEYDENGFLVREIRTTVTDDGNGNHSTTVTTREYIHIPSVRMQNEWSMRYYPDMPEG